MPTLEGDKESIGTSGTAGTGLITSWGPISLHTAIREKVREMALIDRKCKRCGWQ
jgi:hypothetical protein